MVKSMFAAVAGMRTHQQKMDVIGNNIANVNTYGYKKARMTFKDQFYTTLNSASDPNGERGGTNPSQVGYGSSVGSVDIDFSSSGSEPTNDSSDVMIDGNGFYMVGAKHENGYASTSNVGDLQGYKGPTDNLKDLKFTRGGTFKFGSDGFLTDTKGNVVYGYLNYNYTDPSGTPNYTVQANDGKTLPTGVAVGDKVMEAVRMPLVRMNSDGTIWKGTDGKGAPEFRFNDSSTPPTPPTDGTYYAPIQSKSINFGEDGVVTATFGDKPITIGRIAVADVPNQNAMVNMGGSYYQAAGNTGVITASTPGTGGAGKVQSGFREMSNVDLSQEMADMITTERGFQANTKIITVTDEMLQELINMKR